jgi:hypothetical protein
MAKDYQEATQIRPEIYVTGAANGAGARFDKTKPSPWMSL